MGKNPLEEEIATDSTLLAWENPVDTGAWQATVQGATESWTRLSMHTSLWGRTAIGKQKLLFYHTHHTCPLTQTELKPKCEPADGESPRRQYRGKLHDSRLGKDFPHMIPEAKATKSKMS